MPETREISAKYEFSHFVVDLELGTLVRGGHTVPLQDQPFRLLCLLIRRSGSLVTREEIRDHLWPGNTYVEFDQSLRVAVRKLREALGDSAGEPTFIETHPRRGYRFIASVTVVSTPPTLAPDASPATTAKATAVAVAKALPFEPDQPDSRGRSSARMRAAWVVAIMAVLLTGLYLLQNKFRHKIAPAVSAQPTARRAVAVIGLRNLTGSGADRWLSTALAEMLSSELSASEKLRTISGEEIAHAGLSQPLATTPSRDTLARYGKQLGADIIVTGAYTVSRDGKSPPRMRLDLRLEDLSSDAPSLSLVQTGATSNLFGVVSATGSQLRQKLGLAEMSAQSSTAVQRTLPADPEAAEFFAEGLSRLRDFDPPAARTLLEKAAHLDPQHAGTHLALADAWRAMGYYDEARKEAATAVELGAGLPREELLNMQGELALLSNNWDQAIDIFRSLITFYPDKVDYVLLLAQAQSEGGRSPQALQTLADFRRAGIPQADEARIHLADANVNLQLANFRQAIAAADQAIRIGTELDQKRVRAQGLWIKASGLERLSDAPGSLAASTESQALYRAVGDKYGLGIAMLMTGDVLYSKAQTAEARRNFQSALDLFREVGYRRYTGVALERIGNTYFDEGSFEQSRNAYQQAWDVYREVHLQQGIASVIGNLANVQASEGNIAAALQSDQQGLALFEKTGQKRGVASTLNNMGDLELDRGGLEQASKDFNRAAIIDRQIDYPRGLANANIGQADVLLERGATSGALHAYDVAEKIVEGMDEPGMRSSAQISIGHANFIAGNLQQAAACFRLALQIAAQDNDHASAAIALALQSHLLLAQGHLQPALDAANQAVSEAQSQWIPSIRIQATLALARVEIAQGNIPAAREKLRAALAVAQRDDYAPLAMELEIELARTESSIPDRRRKLDALSREASQRGWTLLATQAHSTNPMD